MSIDKYDPIRLLGEGSFGKVYLMRDKVKRNFVCVKVIKIKNIPKKEREATKLEVDLLRRLHHPNIVRYLDSFLSRNNETLCICMEYCDGGDLASQIKAARQNLFSESKILHWFVQIALGLHYMHSNKVLHRDLKTQNVFLLGNGRLVLGDLGISKVLDGTMDFAQTCIGTPYYMSPEIFSNKPYSYKSDVWALGCVLYEMTTLNHAFDANSLNGLAQKIVKGRYPPIHQKYSKYLKELIGSMLLINPQQRPDLDQILRKPFIKKHIVNFFTDIASRPSTSIGEGTMIVRAAAGGALSGALSNDSNMLALRKQLQDLEMDREVSDALNPKPVPETPVEAKKVLKDQASALRREEDHKKMVEAALEKLRLEREARAKERANGVAGAGAAGPVAGSAAAQGARAKLLVQNNSALPPRQEIQKPAASRQPVPAVANVAPAAAPVISPRASPAAVPSGGSNKGVVRDGGVGYSRKDGAAPSSNPSSNINPDAPFQRRRRTLEEKESQEQAEKKAAEERRIRELEAVNKERSEFRRREEVREQARLRDEAKAREEIKLKEEAAAKQRMDEMRAQAEAAARRDQQREKERARQREEIENLKRDKIELDRLAQERDRIREERRAEERKKLDDARRDRMTDYSQDKVGPPLQDPYSFDPSRGQQAAASQSKPGTRSPAEDKMIEGVSARDKVLLRKQEKQAREEQERLDALREAEAENRRIRAEADVQKRRIYEDSSVPYPKPSAPRAAAAPGPTAAPVAGGRMSNDEVAAKLADAVRGQPKRYEPTPDEIEEARTVRRMINREMGEDGDSDEISEDEGIFEKAGAADEVDEEEELIEREQELRAELNIATQRVQELQRTLQETKSFIGAHGIPLPTKLSSLGVEKANRKPATSTIESADGGDSDYDDNFDLDESLEIVEEEDLKTAASGNSRPSAAASSTRSQPAPTAARMAPSSGLNINVDRDTTPPRRFPLHNPPQPQMQANSRNPAYQNLQDPPTPSGRLIDRIDRLRQKCIEALGRDAFEDAYTFLKQCEESSSSGAMDGPVGGYYDDDAEEYKKSQMRSILGAGKAHYTPLIEQLIFMEETHN